MRSERREPCAGHRWLRALPAMGLACATGIAIGCDRQLAQTSVTDRFARADQELDHAEALESTPIVTNNDMLHGFIVFVDG